MLPSSVTTRVPHKIDYLGTARAGRGGHQPGPLLTPHVGRYLLSVLGVSAGTLAISVYMFVLGAGIGLVMQVLIIAVQNVVPYTPDAGLCSES